MLSLRSARRAARAARDAWRDRIPWREFMAAIDQARLERQRHRQWRELPGMTNADIEALPEPEHPEL